VAAEIGGVALRCDVSDAGEAERAVAAARDAHGAARIAVNCAGVATGGRVVGRDGPHDLNQFRRTIEINLIGSFNILRLAAAGMASLEPLEDGERGVIVSTASVAAYEGQIGQAAYSASKGGIAAMTLPIARELARHGIRVMAVAPGLIATPMMTGLPLEVQESLVATTLFPKRLGHAEEFADLVLHVASNRMLNGEVIRLDGAVRLAPR
jgi:NAD(P)-dependent dehydrogenase (short-subunit alcohol dehydrogenase family)